METAPKKKVAILALDASPIAGMPDRMSAADHLLDSTFKLRAPNGGFIEIQPGVLLIDLDACFPALLNLIGQCNSQKQLSPRILVAELAQTPLLV